MRVIQIANDYLNSGLYMKLFEAQNREGIDNVIFVPVDYRNKIKIDNVYIYPCFSQLDRILYYPKQKKIIIGLENIIDIKNIDIIHAHTLFSAGYTALKLKEKYNIPYIVAVRNTDVNIFFELAPHLKRVGIKVMQNADRVIFLSPAYQHTVIKKYVPNNMRREIYRKSLVIPNGISEFFLDNCLNEKRAAIKNTKDIKLIYAGEVNQNKNLRETIKAAKILKNRGYEISIIVVGEITDSKCREFIKEDCVEYHKKCSQEQLIKYYRKADIFVMPSHTETFGLVYAEAMSQGLPVLYTRGQGFDGHFADGHVGYAVSDLDERDLADKIEMVINRYCEISANCLDGCQRFNWNLISRKYNIVYQKIMMGSSGR